jgi:hypothetical protein
MRGRHGPNRASFGRAFGRRERGHAEAEGARVDVILPQPRAQLLGQQRQLVRPNAARNTQNERSRGEYDRMRVFGNAGPHGIAPELRGDRPMGSGEAALARATQDGIEGLWRE